jgi:hypothetical protein
MGMEKHRLLTKAWAFLFSVCLLGSIVAAQKATSDDELKFAMFVHRHGDRAPISRLSVVSEWQLRETWPQGLGELTALGMHQIFLLGQRLRDAYIGDAADNPGFLPATYNASLLYVDVVLRLVSVL